MVDSKDKQFLELCLSKQLLDRKTAAAVYQQGRREGRDAAAVLATMGVLGQHTIDALVRELARESAPLAIAGFRIIRKLGQGGMGAVYLAEQLSLHREVALKVVASQFSADAQAVDRFMREARTAAAINHPNIISVIDVGYDGGQLYMALELVAGGDAAGLAARFNGILPEARALEIAIDCAQGLGALYEARLIHRDIKPANIFITRDGVAKLGDLGLARSEQGGDRLTVSGHAVGTPAYMSPEQASGRTDLDIRSDLYALGATLFALTTGSPPFTGDGIFAIAAKLLTEPAPDPRTLNPRLSPATAALIARCLAKDAAERFQTPQELALALAAALAAVNATADLRPGTPAPVRTEAIAAARGHPDTRAVAPRRPRPTAARAAPPPWPLIISGAVGMLAIAALTMLLWTPRRAAEPPARPPVSDPVVRPATGGPMPAPATPEPAIGGLVAYWPLDERSGSEVRDRVGGAPAGVITKATWTAGQVGGALAFARPSKVDCGNAARLAPRDGITVMCWIRTTMVVPEHYLASVLRHDGHFTALQLSPDGTAHASIWGSGTMNMAVFPWRGVWDDGRWHHYAVTYERAAGTLVYMDGRLYATPTGSTGGKVTGVLPASAPAPFMLGAAESDNEYFEGALDEVRVYDHPLSAVQIAQLAAIPAPPR